MCSLLRAVVRECRVVVRSVCMRWLGALLVGADAASAGDFAQGETPISFRPQPQRAAGKGAFVLALLVGAFLLSGCETSKLSDVFKFNTFEDPQTTAAIPRPAEEADVALGGGGPAG